MPQLDQLIILPIMVAFLLVFLWLIYYFDFFILKFFIETKKFRMKKLESSIIITNLFHKFVVHFE